jgi:uncharacterized membrane protein YbhN (UPF0104 family)
MPTTPERRTSGSHRAARFGAVLASVVVAGWLVARQVPAGRAALHRLAGVSPPFLVAGLVLEFASLLAYSALTGCVLPRDGRPPLGTLLRIDLSALALSHVVPGGGATATALRYRLLTRAGQAPAAVLAGLVLQGAGLAVLLALVFGAGALLVLPAAHGPTLWATAAVTAPAVAGTAWLAWSVTRRRTATIRQVRGLAARLPGTHPDTAERLVLSLASRIDGLAADPTLRRRTLLRAGGNVMCDAAALAVFLRAFGPYGGLRVLLLGYGLAGLLALLPLTPGGLGLVEATLVSVLVGSGVPHGQALLGVLTWRLAEFWLPIPLGAIAYLSLRATPARRRGSARM